MKLRRGRGWPLLLGGMILAGCIVVRRDDPISTSPTREPAPQEVIFPWDTVLGSAGTTIGTVLMGWIAYKRRKAKLSAALAAVDG